MSKELNDSLVELNSLYEKKCASMDDLKLGSSTAVEPGQFNNIKRKLVGHYGKVYAMHWAGEGMRNNLVSASQDGKLIVWDALNSAKVNAVSLRSSWVMTCAFNRDGNKTVASGGLDNMCSIYDLSLAQAGGIGKPIAELTQHDGYLSCCRFIKGCGENNQQIITSSGDSQCILWDIATKQVLSVKTDHSADVMSVSTNPTDPNVFASGSCDATVKIFDLRTDHCVFSFAGHESDINAVTFMSNGYSIASASDDSSAMIWDTRCLSSLRRLQNEKVMCGITSIDTSSSGAIVYCGYDDYSLWNWDSRSDDSVRNAHHENRISCLGVNTEGKALCTGSWDNTLHVFA